MFQEVWTLNICGFLILSWFSYFSKFNGNILSLHIHTNQLQGDNGNLLQFLNKIGSFDNDVYKSQKFQNPPQNRCEIFSFYFYFYIHIHHCVVDVYKSHLLAFDLIQFNSIVSNFIWLCSISKAFEVIAVMKPLKNPKKLLFQFFLGVKVKAHSHILFSNLLFLSFISLVHKTFHPWNLNIFTTRLGFFKILE